MKNLSNLFYSLIVISFLFEIGNCKAQDNPSTHFRSKIYFKGSLGTSVSTDGFYSGYQSSTQTYAVKSKLGSGFTGSVGAGYELNPFLAFELDFMYLYGTKKVMVNQRNPSDKGNDEYMSLQSSMPQLTPAIVFSAPLGIFRPYMRIGLNMGLPEVTEEYGSEIYVGNYPDMGWAQKRLKFHGGYSLGSQAAIGCYLPLKNNRVNLFFEAEFNNITYLPSNLSLTSYTIDGVDKLQTISTNEKETVFKKEIPYNYNPSTDKPAESLQNILPLSGVNFQAGVKINLKTPAATENSASKNKELKLRLSAGYGFPVNSTRAIIMTDSLSYKIGKFSGGSGINIGAGIGYMFNSHFGVDLGFNYTSGSINYTWYYPYNEQIHNKVTGSMAQVIPSLIIATNAGKLNPYAKMGLIIGSGQVTNTYENNSPLDNYNSNETWKAKGGISLGYNGTLGLEYPLNKKFSVYSEASFNTIYYFPDRLTQTEKLVNGVNELDNMTYHNKNTIFKSSYSSADNNDPSKPTVSTPVKFSFCAAVINIGVKMQIWSRN
jgi:hypothetical protein